MQNAIAWLKLHPAVYIGFTTWLVATLKVLFTSRPAIETGLDLLLESIGSGSYKGETGQLGRLSFPILGRSRRIPAGADVAAKSVAPKVLVPFLFMSLGATLLPSCATPGAIAAKQTLQTCEVNSLPQTEQSAMVCAINVASNASQPVAGVQGALEGCATSLLPGQASCLFQALVAWLKGSVPPHGQADMNLLLTISKLETYLAAHPVKADCGCRVPLDVVSDFLTPTTRPLWAMMASGGAQ